MTACEILLRFRLSGNVAITELDRRLAVAHKHSAGQCLEGAWARTG
jgi:hypothetical protein